MVSYGVFLQTATVLSHQWLIYLSDRGTARGWNHMLIHMLVHVLIHMSLNEIWRGPKVYKWRKIS